MPIYSIFWPTHITTINPIQMSFKASTHNLVSLLTIIVSILITFFYPAYSFNRDTSIFNTSRIVLSAVTSLIVINFILVNINLQLSINKVLGFMVEFLLHLRHSELPPLIEDERFLLVMLNFLHMNLLYTITKLHSFELFFLQFFGLFLSSALLNKERTPLYLRHK